MDELDVKSTNNFGIAGAAEGLDLHRVEPSIIIITILEYTLPTACLAGNDLDPDQAAHGLTSTDLLAGWASSLPCPFFAFNSRAASSTLNFLSVSVSCLSFSLYFFFSSGSSLLRVQYFQTSCRHTERKVLVFDIWLQLQQLHTPFT
jgi:hypothetical protein